MRVLAVVLALVASTYAGTREFFNGGGPFTNGDGGGSLLVGGGNSGGGYSSGNSGILGGGSGNNGGVYSSGSSNLGGSLGGGSGNLGGAGYSSGNSGNLGGGGSLGGGSGNLGGAGYSSGNSGNLGGGGSLGGGSVNLGGGGYSSGSGGNLGGGGSLGGSGYSSSGNSGNLGGGSGNLGGGGYSAGNSGNLGGGGSLGGGSGISGGGYSSGSSGNFGGGSGNLGGAGYSSGISGNLGGSSNLGGSGTIGGGYSSGNSGSLGGNSGSLGGGLGGGKSLGGGGSSGGFGGSSGGVGGGNQGVAYSTGGGFGGSGLSGGGATVGQVNTLDTFRNPVGVGGAGTGTGGIQVGTAQVSIRDRAADASNKQASINSRHFNNADAGAGRYDNQQRRGDLKEGAYNKNDNQFKESGSSHNRNYDQNLDRASQSAQRQTDVNDKHGVGLESAGRYYRNDLAKNNGDKSLAARKNAFARQNLGLENIDYGFKKNFDTNFNERGGFKEAVGQDNNDVAVYREKQRDNRFSKGEDDYFKKSSDNDAFKKQSDWLSNAAQQQNINNKYGANDHLRDAAEQRDLDHNRLLDRKNDVFWHRDSAQDKAVRQANDVATKNANQYKNALANAQGKKGVTDNKYYGGGSYGKAGATGAAGAGGRGGNVALGTAGVGGVSGTGGGYVSGGSGPISSGGIITTGNQVGAGVGSPSNARVRQEGSGGDYVNAYNEKAVQQDQAKQQQNSAAQSDAKALNDYNRGRGVDDSVEINGQREGKWAKDRKGLKDANSQGYNNANAGAAKRAQLADNTLEARVSDSNLDAARKNFQAQELDRINTKSNQVDSNQRIKKQKKFYHDKNEDGFNNEALNYNRNKGNQDWGEEQQAQKEARTKYGNAADDNKVNTMARSFNNLDARRISDADASYRKKDNSGGWASDKQAARDAAAKNRNANDNNRASSDFDSFGSNVNNRNQQLWDQARKELTARQRGSQKDRSVDAAFQFSPDVARNQLGSTGGGSGFGGAAAGGGASRFSGGGRGGGGSFGGSGGSFMAPIGKSSFGQY